MKLTEGMLRDNALKGKTIVVTGGGSGLGKAMTKYFMELGANTVITSRRIDLLKETAKELEEQTCFFCFSKRSFLQSSKRSLLKTSL